MFGFIKVGFDLEIVMCRLVFSCFNDKAKRRFIAR